MQTQVVLQWAAGRETLPGVALRRRGKLPQVACRVVAGGWQEGCKDTISSPRRDRYTFISARAHTPCTLLAQPSLCSYAAALQPATLLECQNIKENGRKPTQLSHTLRSHLLLSLSPYQLTPAPRRKRIFICIHILICHRPPRPRAFVGMAWSTGRQQGSIAIGQQVRARWLPRAG